MSARCARFDDAARFFFHAARCYAASYSISLIRHFTFAARLHYYDDMLFHIYDDCRWLMPPLFAATRHEARLMRMPCRHCCHAALPLMLADAPPPYAIFTPLRDAHYCCR